MRTRLLALIGILVLVGGCTSQMPRSNTQTNVTATSTSISTTTPDDKLASFVPAHWQIFAEAIGDLNKDGLNDEALILNHEKEVEADVIGADDLPPRQLIILFQNKDGSFTEVASSSKAVLCKQCGGVFGEPFDSMGIEKNVLTLSFYGGSRDRWGYTYKWRWQNNGLYLIGRTDYTADNALLTSQTKDDNLITGAYTIVSQVPDGYKNDPELSDDDRAEIDRWNVSKKGKNPIKPLVRLDDFDINQNP